MYAESFGCLFLFHIHLIVYVSSQSGGETFRILGSGEKPSEGSVQIYKNGDWRHVRDNDFRLKEAEIICNEAGYGRSRVLYSLNSFHGPSRSDAIRFDCWDRATRFSQCVVGRVEKTNHKWETAGVNCQPNLPNIDVRLVNGKNLNGSIGKVQVLFDGQWGGVCGGVWGNEPASVVCRQLGYKNVHTFGIHFWSEKYTEVPFLMDNPVCYGNETNFGQCQSRPYTDTKCSKYYPYQSRAVACLTEEEVKQSFDVKLESSPKSPSNDSGKLLVGVAGLWGWVCPDRVDFKTATVFCKHMGYLWGSSMDSEKLNEIYHVWISTIECNGTEASIFECKNLKWITEGCYKNEIAAIRCFHTPHPEDPVVEKISEGVLVEDGEVTLRCSIRAKETAPVTLRWDCYPYSLMNASFNGTHNVSTLTYRGLHSYRNDRHCACTAYTSQGWSGNAYFRFDINFGPLWSGSSLTDPGELSEGENVTIACTVGESRPAPNFLWYIGNVQIRINISSPYSYQKQVLHYTSYVTETKLSFIAKRSYDGLQVMCSGWNNITEKFITNKIRLKIKTSLTPVAKIYVDKEDNGLYLKFRCDTVGLTTIAPVLWMVDDVTVLSPIPYFTMKIPGHLLPGNYSCHIRTADGLQKIPATIYKITNINN